MITRSSSRSISFPVTAICLAVIASFTSLNWCAASQVLAWGGYSSPGLTNIPAGLTNVVMVSSGYKHSAALRNDGTVVAWAALGQSSALTNVPADLTNIISIAAGQNHTLALKADGSVIAWGRNDFGQTNVPNDLTNVAAVAAGLSQNLALTRAGRVVTWGGNFSGIAVTNVPAGLSNVVAIAANLTRSFALRADGRVVAWESSTVEPADWTNVVAIAGNVHFSQDQAIALKADTTISAWFSPTPPAGLSNVIAIAPGGVHGMALKVDGTITGWGSVAVPAGLAGMASVACGLDNSLALVGGGPPYFTDALVNRTVSAGRPTWLRAFATGLQPISYQWQFYNTNLPWGTNSVLSIANVTPEMAGNYSVVASNAAGQTLSPELFMQVAPAVITSQPKSQTVVLGLSPKLAVEASAPASSYQWRFNGTNLVGANSTSLTLSNIQMVQAGNYSVTISNEFGTVVSDDAVLQIIEVAIWGDNSRRQANPPTLLTNIAAIAAGYVHCLALRRDGSLEAWGWNSSQQGTVPAGISNVLGIAAGDYHNTQVSGYWLNSSNWL